MRDIKKLAIAVGIFIVLLTLFLLLLTNKPVEKATLTTDISGENLASYVVTIDNVATEGGGDGLLKTYSIGTGKHVIGVEANGFSTYIKEIDAKPGDNKLKATLVEFSGPQRAVMQALNLKVAPESKNRQESLDVIAEDGTSYSIKYAAYFRDNTWLVASIGSSGEATDGEVSVMQLINGVWTIVTAGTGLSNSDLIALGVPAEVADYVDIVNTQAYNDSTSTGSSSSETNNSVTGITNTNTTRTVITSSSLASTAKRPTGAAACKTGTDVTACEAYLRNIGAYFAGNGGTNTQRCGVSGLTTNSSGSATGNYLTITFPSGVNETDLATRIEAFIRGRKPDSPWLTIPNIGTRLVTEGKKHNVNPLLIVVLGVSESNLGTSGLARRQNNYFGQKATGSTYRTFASPEDSLFGPNSILVGMPNRLATHSSYKNVKNLYDYLSVHVSGQIMYPGDNIRIYDPIMKVYVTSEVDAQYGPIPYWKLAVQIINKATGQNYPSTPPARGSESAVTTTATGGTSGVPSCAQAAGEGGWDLPGEGPNPMTYYSQLYKCTEDPPDGRTFAKACDKAVADNAFGSVAYGTGTIEKCGCGPTSVAMVVTTLTGKRTLPTDVARYAEQNGGVQASGCGSEFFWTQKSAQDFYGITVTPINASQMSASLRAGQMILVSLTQFPTIDSDVGHISVIRKVDGSNNFYFADSYAGAWGTEKKPETASRMQFTEAQLAGMTKAIWSVSKK